MEVVKKLGIIVAGLCVTTAGFSVTQGTLGTTSTGAVDINLTIPALAKITKLTDINITATDPLPATVSGGTTACVFSNSTDNKYSVTATGSGNAFTLGANGIPYTASWGGVTLDPGTALTNQTGSSNPTCGTSSTNATLTVTFADTDIAAATPGLHTGTITLLITPT